MKEMWAELQYRLGVSWTSAWRWIADRFTDERRDKEFGIESSERRSLAELGIASTDSEPYQPVSYEDFEEIMRVVAFGDSDVFLDFGCGMGRAVCLAAMHPWRAVIGVEISGALCDGARRNVERVRPKLRCRDVRIVEQDAAAYEVPAEVTVIYFFNPFVGEVLAHALRNVGESLREFPREVLLIFRGTVSADRFRSQAAVCDWMAPVSELVLPTGAKALFYAAGEATAGKRRRWLKA
jgi:SAM-dependent methyltransferase